MTRLALLKDPRLLFAKLRGHILSRLRHIPDSTVVRFGDVVFEVRRSTLLNEGDYRGMALGAYDLLLQRYLRQHLRPGDTFIDIGANVGFVSAFAASLVGPHGYVLGLEPISELHRSLARLRAMNPRYRFNFLTMAAGACEEVRVISFDPEGDVRNATLAEASFSQLRKRTSVLQQRSIRVTRLDELTISLKIDPRKISVIKIDVEGFEPAVMDGLQGILRYHRPQIICEIKPWEWPSIGYRPEDLMRIIQTYNYVITCPFSGRDRPLGSSFDTIALRPA